MEEETPEEAEERARRRERARQRSREIGEGLAKAFKEAFRLMRSVDRPTPVLLGFSKDELAVLLAIARCGGSVPLTAVSAALTRRPRVIERIEKLGFVLRDRGTIGLTPRGTLFVRNSIERHHVRHATKMALMGVMIGGIGRLSSSVDRMMR